MIQSTDMLENKVSSILLIIYCHVNVKYKLIFKRRAIKDLKVFSHNVRERILAKIVAMQDDLQGDIKKLTNFTPEYRLRVGQYRILFKIDGESLIIYRVKHRKDAYK